MLIKSAKFVISNSDIKGCPAPKLPEVAFIGRSNVGKSSLINMLVNHKGLAKTSAKPGKTQLINHFIVNDSWYLVDLPGYGYAQTSKTLRAGFSQIITTYISKRTNLLNLFVLIDCRLEPQSIDLQFLRWLGQNGVPFSLVFTKCDKLGKNKLAENIDSYKKKLLVEWSELPPSFITSATAAMGRDELLQYIDSICKQK
ncbi:MAG: ribosome biogenesis GTP-binding protein YihA/YsxC [Bacteroidia bacterium]|jgi:GTP-binding protein